MEKINRDDINNIPSLEILANNWEQWGIDYNEFRSSKGKNGQDFSWRNGIYQNLRNNLADLTKHHCSFCDGFPFDTSKETVEHYKPKNEFLLISYQYDNLFYCCDKCQSNSNKTYVPNLKPDHKNYSFSDIFDIDLSTFEIYVLDHLEKDDAHIYDKAITFLDRYGINQKERITRRKGVYKNLKNYFKTEYGEEDQRIRDDFPYRYLYDLLHLTQTQ